MKTVELKMAALIDQYNHGYIQTVASINNLQRGHFACCKDQRDSSIKMEECFKALQESMKGIGNQVSLNFGAGANLG